MPCRRPRRLIRRPLLHLGAVLLPVTLAALGCRDAVSPVDPAPDLATAAATSPLTFTQISAGNAHSCGVTTGGLAYCWGLQAFGELGDGTQSTTHDAPVAVVGGLRFSQIRAAVTHTCGLTTDGLAYCWGQNDLGQLGDGSTPTHHFSPVPVAGGRKFIQIQVGFEHSCALTSAGVAFCWGMNASGQLGIGNQTGPQVCGGQPCAVRPVRVTGGHTFRQIRAAGQHSCGLDDARRFFCWGQNDLGQLGDGTRATRLLPTPVAGDRRFVQVSTQSYHTCGVTAAQVAFCWGLNQVGQLGDGTTTNRPRPTRVQGGLTFSGLSAGTSHTCGVTVKKQAYCWGSNEHGELGDGTTTDRHRPTAVQGGLFWDDVSAGWQPSCGLVPGGRAYCWGSLAVGDGTGQMRKTPTPVAAPI
jgi:alpha-tubulin suppressor-like RCC1 family protein